MELILTETIKDVGSKGDVVTVRDGFARNFLLPRKVAIAATRANRQFVDEQRVRAEKRQEKERAIAREKVSKLEEVKISLEASVGEGDKLFGSITSEDISKALKEQGWDFEKKKIQLKNSLRSLGIYKVDVEIYPQVKAAITVEVIRKP